MASSGVSLDADYRLLETDDGWRVVSPVDGSAQATRGDTFVCLHTEDYHYALDFFDAYSRRAFSYEPCRADGTPVSGRPSAAALVMAFGEQPGGRYVVSEPDRLVGYTIKGDLGGE